MYNNQQISLVLSKIQEVAELKHLQDDDNFETGEFYNPADNGNYDDAFEGGVKCGRIDFARELMVILGGQQEPCAMWYNRGVRRLSRHCPSMMRDYLKWLFSRSYRLRLKRERDETFAISLLNHLRDTKMERTEWMPIETAPKDREIYVCGLARVWADSDPFVWQGHACWADPEAKWITEGFDDSGDNLFVEATHWTEPRNLEFPDHPFYSDPADCEG